MRHCDYKQSQLGRTVPKVLDPNARGRTAVAHRTPLASSSASPCHAELTSIHHFPPSPSPNPIPCSFPPSNQATDVAAPAPGAAAAHHDDRAPLPAPASLQLGAPLRSQFPILDQTVNGHPLVYLDNAATSQKPHAVLRALSDCYQEYNANVHRGVHALSARATQEYEDARAKVAALIGARNSREVVITRNATEAINLVANTWGLQNIKPGDEVGGGAGRAGVEDGEGVGAGVSLRDPKRCTHVVWAGVGWGGVNGGCGGG